MPGSRAAASWRKVSRTGSSACWRSSSPPGHGGAATSRQGALHALAQQSFGRIVLILLAIGFAAYALWRAVQGFAMPAEEGKDWLKRAGFLGRAAVYIGLTFSALSILLGDDGGSSQDRRRSASTVRSRNSRVPTTGGTCWGSPLPA
jgi:hypothetical protein